MKALSKTEIGVLIATVVVLVTANAYWRVKETGRRQKWVLEHEQIGDAGADADAAADASSTD